MISPTLRGLAVVSLSLLVSCVRAPSLNMTGLQQMEGQQGRAAFQRGRVIEPDSIVVRLRSGPVTISAASTARFFDTLRAITAEGLHGLALLRGATNDAQRRQLEQRGLTLLSPLHGRAYRVRVAKAIDVADTTVRASLVALALLQPQDRVTPAIWNGEYSRYTLRRAPHDSVSYVIGADGMLRVTVASYRDVSDSDLARLLRMYTTTATPLGAHYWGATMSRDRMQALASADLVRWIDAAPPPPLADNDDTRSTLGVEPVQNFSMGFGLPMGLGGRGVQVGVFDEGIDELHDDFKVFALGYSTVSRVKVTSPAASWHGTLVAGVIGASGRRSTMKDNWGVVNGGTPWQWRGMAPLAELLEVDINSVYYSPALVASSVRSLIVDHSMDVSNHSYEVDGFGEYAQLSAQRDSMIRGDGTSGTLTIPPRLQVFSAGNLGGSDGTAAVPGTTSNDHGYFSLGNQLKNALLVGSWSSALKRIVGSSSLGPTTDGRIKPDVVAPGSRVKSTGYWKPGSDTRLLCTEPASGTYDATRVHQQFYGIDCGTSLAAPAVTGVLALVLEQFAVMGVDLTARPPLPSSLRALIIHSATDVGNEMPSFSNVDGPVQAFRGPDFATGFGLVNAKAAVDLVANGLAIEGAVTGTCDARQYDFMVVAALDGSVPELRATLAWDDAAEQPDMSATEPRLQNDLDLVLIDPSGARHYPWQRNQIIRDASMAPMSADAQTCGSPINVEQMLHSPGPVSASDLAAASTGTGPDHLNNVEQVVVAGSVGKWTAVVTGFKVDAGRQTFSLVGVPHNPAIRIDPLNLCAAHKSICFPWLIDLCKRYPQLCESSPPIPISPETIRLTFRDPVDRVIVPLRQLCDLRNAHGRCDALVGLQELSLGPSPIPLAATVYDGDGHIVATTRRPATSARIAFRATAGADYFLILSPPAEVRAGRVYDVPLRLRNAAP